MLPAVLVSVCQFIDLSTRFEQCWFKAGKCLHFPYRWEKQKLCLYISMSNQHLPLNLELRGSVVFGVEPAEWNTAISLRTFVIWGAASWKLRQKYYCSPFACAMKVSLCINTVLFTIVFSNNGDLKRPHHKAVSLTVGRAFL